MSSDTKICKLPTESTCMDWGCISNKVDQSKSLCLSIICFDRVSVRDDCALIIVATVVHQVIEDLCLNPNFGFPFPKSSERPKPKSASGVRTAR